jgi:hypothetical protein
VIPQFFYFNSFSVFRSKIAVLNNELNAYAQGGSRMELAAAQSGPDPARFVPTNDLLDEAPGNEANHPSSTPPNQNSDSSSSSGGKKRGDGSRSHEHSLTHAGMRAYFADSKGLPDLLYLQAGGWDRAIGCLERRDFALRLNDTAELFAATAPGAAVVLGTLPTGAAYPADPRPEMARLKDQENNDKMKQRVGSCLR